MSPPYRMLDDATGRVAEGPNGEKWEGIDIPPGHKMELFDTTDNNAPWPRVSPSEIVRPDAGVPPIDPPPIEPPIDPGIDPNPPLPPSGDGMFKPTTANEFKDALQSALQAGQFLILDPTTSLELREPLVFDLYGGGAPHGLIGNGAQFHWQGAGGADMLTFRGDKSRGVNTNLVIDNIYCFGNGYAGAPAGDCIKLHAPTGDPGSIYKFKLANLYCNYATRGIMLEGAVFEGYCDNIHSENMRSHGMECAHTWTPGEHQGIISNINIIHPNLSRNFGAGLKCTYSTNLIYGSFVLNALGGVLAPDGLRYAAGSNGENTGPAVFVLGSAGYGSVITGCEGSSDGSTHARAYEGGQWVSKGEPMFYLIDGPCDQAMNHVSYYGSGSNPMRVVK